MFSFSKYLFLCFRCWGNAPWFAGRFPPNHEATKRTHPRSLWGRLPAPSSSWVKLTATWMTFSDILEQLRQLELLICSYYTSKLLHNVHFSTCTPFSPFEFTYSASPLQVDPNHLNIALPKNLSSNFFDHWSHHFNIALVNYFTQSDH